ncbi:hypothetical protein SAMD00019534_000280, partial [Acytostelium subglobosum LB1]|uniref:hypothetical protein n=1 Tax=Acytostelium subglobosum LB1 TaxID=1410327 RepID=UPI0006448EC3
MDSLEYDNVIADIELMVDMTCQSCVKEITVSIENNLRSTRVLTVDVPEQRLVVRGTDLSIDVIDTIKSTGRSAIIAGFGSKGSAVCSVGVAPDGWEKGCGGAGGEGVTGVHGIIRVIEIDTPSSGSGLLFEGRIGGLQPGAQHSLVVHQFGDLTKGCDNVGLPYKPTTTNKQSTGTLGTTITSEEGKTQFRIFNKDYDIWDLIGRSIVLHSVNPQTKESNKRLACGIICRAATVGQNPKKICPCDNQPTLTIAEQQQLEQQQQQQSNL